MPNIPTIPNFPPQGIQAQLDLLYLYNPDAANNLVAQLEAGLLKIEELQKEIEKALQDMQGVLRYKGSVQTEADLPTTGNVIGDVWNIISTDENVAWTGTEWDKFGSTIDTSVFLTKDAAKDAYINADASTYTLATLQDAFNYSPARLYKIFNEDKMPTKNTFTLFSLGWTYNDTNNMPTLLASDLQTGKFYFYHGTYENCSPTTWQEFTFGGDALAQEVETNKNDLADLEAKIPEDATSTNQLATKSDVASVPGLPDQTGRTGFLQTDGTTATWSDKAALVNNSDLTQASAVGEDATAAIGGTSFGKHAVASSLGLAIGTFTRTSSNGAIALGYGARCKANNSAFINTRAAIREYSVPESLGFGNTKGVYTIVGADGTIPSERLAADGTAGQVLAKTDTGMQWIDANAGGDYLPLSGGQMTGYIKLTATRGIGKGNSTAVGLGDGTGYIQYEWGDTYFRPTGNVMCLGWPTNPWAVVYTKKLNNGADIAVPTTGGTMALVEDLQAVTAAAHLANGVKGDYCSTYAVIKAPNGRPRIKASATNTVTVPAGLVFDCPLSTDPNDTSTGLITWVTQEDVEITETTTDCFLVYVHALGAFKVCNKICFTPAQPEEGTEPCMMWFNGEYWQLKSDDTGNVWRKTRAHPVCKCIFTNGVLTRLNYIGWYDIPEDVA